MGEHAWGFRHTFTTLGPFMWQVLAMVAHNEHFMIAAPAPQQRKPRRKARRAAHAT